MTKEKQIQIIQDEMQNQFIKLKDRFEDVLIKIQLPVLPHE